MTPGFEPLGDDRVGSAALEPARLLDRRRAGEDDRAGSLDPIEQPTFGQAEVEADDAWLDLLDDGAHRFVERQAQRPAGSGLCLIFVIVRLKQLAPRAVVRSLRHRVTEEIEVDRLCRTRPNFGRLCPHLVGRQQRARERTEGSAERRGSAQLDPAGAGHRRLDDRLFGSDQITEPPIGPAYHSPLLGIDAHGSAGACAAPFWSSSIEMPSGERTNAMRPSRGGRLMVTPASISRRQRV